MKFNLYKVNVYNAGFHYVKAKNSKNAIKNLVRRGVDNPIVSVKKVVVSKKWKGYP